MRIAVLLPNWVGDAVMATPSLGALRHQYPHATICGVMRPLIAETLSGCGFFDETIFYDRRSADVQAQFWPVSGRLRRFLPEMFISLTNSPRARLLQWLSSANETIGLKRRWYDRWLTTPVDIPSLRRHEPFSAVDTYRALMVAAGCPPADRVPRLATRPRDEIAADDAFRDLEIRPGEPVVALNTGSANGPAKDWPTESFAELARRVQSQWGAFVLILCGPAEREKARQVEAAARHPRIRSIAMGSLCAHPLRTRGTRKGSASRSRRPPSAHSFHRKPDPGHRPYQSLYPAQPHGGDDRQRAAAYRGGVRHSGGESLWTDRSAME